jgi:hypothetical protein
VETREAPPALGETEGLRPGARLLAVGFPRSSAIGARSATVTRGAFSALWRSPEDVWFVQTDAALYPGNSAGPVVDAQRRVVRLVAEFTASMDLSVKYVQDERAMLTPGVPRTDGAAWKRFEEQGNVSAARFDAFKKRYDAAPRD